MRKLKYTAAGLALTLLLSGCGQSTDDIVVQRVDSLTAAAVAPDRFAGVVVSDNAVTIEKESDKTVSELLVQEGEKVRQGQALFSYDSDELSLSLDKQELELDRLEAEIDDLEDQIKDVKSEIKKASGDAKTQLNIQQRQLEMELTQAKYDKEAMEADIEYTEDMLKNVDVSSPIDGTVRSINQDNDQEFIVIQQTGAYRVKGMLNEMNLSMGIMEGASVQITSRLDPEQTWSGEVELIDYENAEQNSYDAMYYGMGDSMTTSSSYPFYIGLDSTDGLLLGQHVYIQLSVQTDNTDGIYLPESYLMELVYIPETDETTGYVWAVGENEKLEKRQVTVGQYDLTTGSYEIVLGLEMYDYVADPANPNCREGAPVSTGQQELTDESGLTPAEQESIAAEIADNIENAGD